MRILLLLAPLLALIPENALAGEKPTVAVMYFDYQGKDEQMGLLRKGLAQMLISDLSDGESYQIVERDRLQEILDELKLNQSKKIDKKTANKIGKLLGARFMVLGGYFDLMGTLRVDARIVEVETGKVVKSVGGNAMPDEFLQLEQKLAGDLQAVLTGQLPKAQRARPPRGRRRPKSPKKLKAATAVKYSEALDAIDKQDKKRAKKKLQEVLKEQPDFSLAQLDLKNLVQ